MSDYEQEALKLDNQLCFPLYAASREIIKKYRPFLDPLGLTYTQYIAMMVLQEEKEISVKELGRRLFLDSGTLTPVLKSLCEKGWAVKERDSEDERVVIAKLTPLGEDLKEQALPIPAQVGRCVDLEPEDAGKLYEILYKVLKKE